MIYIEELLALPYALGAPAKHQTPRKMKEILFLILFVTIQEGLDAQIINNISVELNIGRYSKETGLFKSEYYSNKFSFINGFNIGFNPSEKWQYYLGVRKLNSTLESGGGYTTESSVINGVELKMGVKISPGNEKKVFLSYGLELFEEVSNQKGTYWVDYPPTYEINHRKNYLGVAPDLTINLKLDRRILIFADTRYRIGRVSLAQNESTQPNKELYPSRNYWLNIFEPLNSVGIRFNFK